MSLGRIQPVLFYDKCRGGTLSVYVTSGPLAALYDPTSLAPISNPLSIDSDGIVPGFLVTDGVHYDLLAYTIGGNLRYEERNVFVSNNVDNSLTQINHSETLFSGSLDSNVIHKLGTMSSLSFTLNPVNPDNANIYSIQFASGSTPTSVTFPAGISWKDSEAPTIEANKLYEISILNNFAFYGAT